MNKIRIKSENLIKIEVNDDGEFIILDPTDLNLYESIYKMIDSIKDAEKKFKEESKENEIIEDEDERTRAEVSSILRYFKAGREAIDMMFGKGASKKIFGEANFVEMFDMFFEQMEPFMKQAGVSIEEYQKKLVAKYANRETRRKVLK